MNTTLIKKADSSPKNNEKTARKETTAERVERVFGLVRQVSKDSITHASRLLDAICESWLLAADVDIGNYEPLNELFKSVSVGDKSAIAAFHKRFLSIDGFFYTYTKESGELGTRSFYSYTAKRGFFPNPAVKGSDEHKQVVEIRKRVMESGVNGLRVIGFGNGDSSNRELERAFDVTDAARRFLSSLVRQGYKSEAFALQKDMADIKIVVAKSELERIALESDPLRRVEKLTKQLEKAKTQAERITANRPAEAPAT